MIAPETIRHHVMGGKRGEAESVKWLVNNGFDTQGNPTRVNGAVDATPKDEQQPPTKDVPDCINFLQALAGYPTLTAIHTDPVTGATGRIETHAFQSRDWVEIAKWIKVREGRANLYWLVNPTRESKNSKALRTDIVCVRMLHVDVDVRAGEDQEAGIARIIDTFHTYKLPPSIITASGGGAQAFWILEKPLVLDGTLEAAEDAKLYNVWLERDLDGDHCHNIDRVMRLPGTTNIPNAVKLKKGRKPALAYVVEFHAERRYSLGDFAKASPDKPKEEATKAEQPKVEGSKRANVDDEPITFDANKVKQHAGWLKTVADLPSNFSDKGKIIIGHSGSIADLNADLKKAGLVEKEYRSWSEVAMALAAVFKADGRYSPEQISAALQADLPCNQHIHKQADTQRAAERCIERSFDPPAKRIARELPWRECRVNGTPLPSMHNARLAISALGIECSNDMFHNKILFGFAGDDVQHELQSILGEVSDDAIISLRQIMSVRFGFDLEDKATRDAVKSLALEHRFNPVDDMLDQAQALWEADRVPRLDRFAPDYLNTEDTPLNRAIGRKTLIAGVKRVRHPGCKHDEITVLESDEGWNKSSAIREMAGVENFSDQSVLGQAGREVQEQLGTIWMHENADLAGLSKSHVEDVKAFASRQVDIARKAFGHFVTKQPRHSIEWGTTNDSTYLQSQTGNRRFWCMAVLKMIDVEKIKRDRLLILGEAAHYEAQGESVVLDEKLWPIAREAQEERRVKHPWENILDDIPSKFIHRVPVADSSIDHELVASADLLLGVLRIEPDRQNQGHGMIAASIMKRLGWERAPGGKVFIGKKQVAGYWRKAPPKIVVEDAKSDEGGQNVIPF